jgi:hypothetical protein
MPGDVRMIAENLSFAAQKEAHRNRKTQMVHCTVVVAVRFVWVA